VAVFLLTTVVPPHCHLCVCETVYERRAARKLDRAWGTDTLATKNPTPVTTLLILGYRRVFGRATTSKLSCNWSTRCYSAFGMKFHYRLDTFRVTRAGYTYMQNSKCFCTCTKLLHYCNCFNQISDANYNHPIHLNHRVCGRLMLLCKSMGQFSFFKELSLRRS